MMNLVSSFKWHQTLDPIKKSGAAPDTNCASVDILGRKKVQHFVYLGATGDTLSGSIKVELELQHCNDNSTWVACADADLSAAVTGTNTGTFAVVDANTKDEVIYDVVYFGSKRYTRVVLNFTGTHTNGICVAAWAISKPIEVPAT